jgi:L-rhamnose mutarotase
VHDTVCDLWPHIAGIAEYNRWHSQVWPELQLLGFRSGSRNYSIFQRTDGLLFLYSEVDEIQAALDRQSPPPPPNDVNDRWQAMMDKVGLVRDYPHNGALEHVMYIGDDRTMDKPF